MTGRHRRTLQVVPPLPECNLCERPTARTAHEANGGLCTECATGLAQTVRMLPVRTPPEADDRTVFVERYRPPVPGQLALEDDDA
jgi:hypothetical protein